MQEEEGAGAEEGHDEDPREIEDLKDSRPPRGPEEGGEEGHEEDEDGVGGHGKEADDVDGSQPLHLQPDFQQVGVCLPQSPHISRAFHQAQVQVNGDGDGDDVDEEIADSQATKIDGVELDLIGNVTLR